MLAGINIYFIFRMDNKIQHQNTFFFFYFLRFFAMDSDNGVLPVCS